MIGSAESLHYAEKLSMRVMCDRRNEPQSFRLYQYLLVSGREVNLGFLKLGEPGVELVSEGEDVRFALIQELQAP